MARWKKEKHGPSKAHPGGQLKGEAKARSVSDVYPSSSCSGTTPGERGGWSKGEKKKENKEIQRKRRRRQKREVKIKQEKTKRWRE